MLRLVWSRAAGIWCGEAEIVIMITKNETRLLVTIASMLFITCTATGRGRDCKYLTLRRLTPDKYYAQLNRDARLA